MPCGLDPSSSLLLSGLVNSRPVSEFFRFGPPAVTRRTLRPNPCSKESGLSSRFKASDRPISYASTFYHGVLKFPNKFSTLETSIQLILSFGLGSQSLIYKNGI